MMKLNTAKCPRCGSQNFRVRANASGLVDVVYESGHIVNCTNVEWSRDDLDVYELTFCTCDDCVFRGVVKDFLQEER